MSLSASSEAVLKSPFEAWCCLQEAVPAAQAAPGSEGRRWQRGPGKRGWCLSQLRAGRDRGAGAPPGQPPLLTLGKAALLSSPIFCNAASMGIPGERGSVGPGGLCYCCPQPLSALPFPALLSRHCSQGCAPLEIREPRQACQGLGSVSADSCCSQNLELSPVRAPAETGSLPCRL